MHGTFCGVKHSRREMCDLLAEGVVGGGLHKVKEAPVIFGMLKNEKTSHEIDQYVLKIL